MKGNCKQLIFRILSLAVFACLIFTACAPDLSQVPYHYGNIAMGGEVCDYGEKVLFTVHVPYSHDNGILRPSKYLLYECDKQTGEVELFCKNASCSHDTSRCPAVGFESLECYEGKVYGRRTVIEDGKERKDFVELKNGRVKTVLSDIGQAQYYQGDLYATPPILSSSSSGPYYEALLKYPEGNLKSPKTLKLGLHFFNHVYIDDSIYFLTEYSSRQLHRLDLTGSGQVETVVEDVNSLFTTDGEYLYYCSQDNHLMRCDLDGSNPISLAQMEETIFSINYDEEYFYFYVPDNTDPSVYGKEQIFRLKKDLTSEPELIANVDFSFSIYTIYQSDLLLLHSRSKSYIINKDGTGLQKLELPA